ERLVPDALFGPALLVVPHALVAQRALGFRKEEIDAAEEAVDLVARLTDGLADFQRQRARELRHALHDALAELADGIEALANRRCRPFRLRLARTLVFRANTFRVVGSDVGELGAGRGIGDFHKA